MGAENFPYILKISIIRGENLIVKDIFSSDPYIIVKLGDVEIGRTSIIFQNRSSPQWNETITMNLLHIQDGPLIFLVYDYDEGKDDDFMGMFHIDFKNIKLGSPLELQQSLLGEDNDEDISRGILYVSILLEKNQNIFKLIEKKDPIKVSDETVAILKKEMDRVNTPQPERVAITLAAAELEKLSLLNVEYIRDLLFDVRNLDEGDFSALPMTLVKHQRSLKAATGYDVNNTTFAPMTPMKGYSIRILSDDDTSLSLSFISRFAMWRWVRSFLTSFAVDSGEEKGSANLKYIYSSGRIDVTESDGTVLANCLCSISPNSPMDFKYETSSILSQRTKSFDLKKTQELFFSVDSPLACEFCVDIHIGSIFMGNELVAQHNGSKFYFVMKADTEVVVTSMEPLPEPKWAQGLAFDVSYDDLNDDTKGLHLFLFAKPSNFNSTPILVGEQFITTKKLLGISVKYISDDDGIEDDKQVDSTHMLNISTTLYIRVKTSYSLPLLKGQSKSTDRELSFKCSYFQAQLKGSAESVFGRRESMRELKSASLSGKMDVDFDDVEFALPAVDGLYCADYVRLRIYSGSGILGDVYVPIADFGLRDHERIYDVVDIGENTAPSSGLGMNPALSLSIRREFTTPLQTSKVDLICRGRRSNEYKSKWYAECLPVSSFDPEESSSSTESDIEAAIEVYSVVPAYKHLILTEDFMTQEELVPKSKRINLLGLNKFNTDRTPKPTEKQNSNAATGETITMYSFENERRSIIPPFHWGVDHLNSSDPPRFSDESGLREFLFETEPPEGYGWIAQWVVDMSSGQTDADGWCYGISFNTLRTNYRKSQNNASNGASYLVRRRRWKRQAVLQPGRRHSKHLMYAGDEKEAVVSLFREHHAQNSSSEAVLKLCREKKSLDDIIRVPWSRVLAVTIVSPSILLVLIEVGKYIGIKGGNETFEDVKMEVFISNCCAANLKCLMEERIEFDPIRKKIMDVIRFGSNTPISKIRESSTRDKLLKQNNEELTLGSEVVKVLVEHLSSITSSSGSRKFGDMGGGGGEMSRPKLGSPKRKGLNRQQSAVSSNSSKVLKISRIKMYIAALCSNSLVIDHDFNPDKVRDIITNDITKSRGISSQTLRVKYVLQAAASRLRDISLTGWSHRGDEFNKCLLLTIHEYYDDVISIFGEFIDSKRIHLMKGISAKIEFLKFFISVDDSLDKLLREAFQVYGLCVTPQANLSLSLKVDDMFAIFIMETKKDMDAAFETIINTWRNKGPGSFKSTLPWFPTRQTSRQSLGGGSDSGPYFTNIPEDVRAAMLPFTEKLAELTDIPYQYREATHSFHRRVELAYVNSFVHLAEVYSLALDETVWTDTTGMSEKQGQDVLEERSIWLCSVVNDCYRIKSESMISNAKPEVRIHGEPDLAYNRVIERARRAYAEFERIRQQALDTISSVIFTHSMKHIEDFETKWMASVTTAGVGGPIADMMYTVKEYLYFFHYIIANGAYFTRLVEICADKVVVLYLSFARDFKRPFTSDERGKIGSDITAINRAFLQGLKGEGSEKNFALVELHLKRIPDVYYLVNDEPDSERFVNTTRRFVGESECHQSDSTALSELLKTCLRLRDWTGYEDHLAPLQELVKIIRGEETEAPLSRRIYENSPEVRVFRMPKVAIRTQLTDSSAEEVATKTAAVPVWGLGAKMMSSKTVVLQTTGTGKKKKVTIRNLKLSNLLSTEYIGTAPSCYILLSTGVTSVKTTLKSSSFNPSWAESFELEFYSDGSLVEKAKLSCQIFYPAIIGLLSSDTLFAKCEVSLAITDGLMGLSGGGKYELQISDTKAVKVAFGTALKKGVELPRLHLSFHFED